jgi:hypothetical protein
VSPVKGAEGFQATSPPVPELWRQGRRRLGASPQGGLGGARLLGVAGHARDLHQPDLGDGDPRRRLSTQMAVALLSPHAVRVTGPDSLCARQRQPGRDRTGLERFQRSATAIVSSVSGTRRAERACRSAPDPALRVQRIVQLLRLWKKGVLLEPSSARHRPNIRTISS